MELSIILINFNTSAFTIKCIRSIYEFTQNVRFEVILVDNASTEIDPGYFVELFPDIKLIRNSTNEGFAKGNNRGIAKATGDVILLINSDAEVLDNSIGQAFQSLKERSEVSVITGKLIFPDGTIQHQCGRFPSIGLQLIELFRIQKLLPRRVRGKLLLSGFFDQAEPVYPDWIWGTFFMLKKDVLDIFPDRKLPETYFMYVEDMEWCYFIKSAGLKIYFDPSLTIVHHAGSSSIPYFGEGLNPMIKANFKDLISRRKGKYFANIYFLLININSFTLR